MQRDELSTTPTPFFGFQVSANTANFFSLTDHVTHRKQALENGPPSFSEHENTLRYGRLFDEQQKVLCHNQFATIPGSDCVGPEAVQPNAVRSEVAVVGIAA